MLNDFAIDYIYETTNNFKYRINAILISIRGISMSHPKERMKDYRKFKIIESYFLGSIE